MKPPMAIKVVALPSLELIVPAGSSNHREISALAPSTLH